MDRNSFLPPSPPRHPRRFPLHPDPSFGSHTEDDEPSMRHICFCKLSALRPTFTSLEFNLLLIEVDFDVRWQIPRSTKAGSEIFESKIKVVCVCKLKAYCAIKEVKENATQNSQNVFVHVPSEIAAHEVEEIGVEHLLRDVKDTTICTLATEVSGEAHSFEGIRCKAP